MTAGPPYSVDTSALIDGLERYYPEQTFPTLWEQVDQLIASGRFLMSEEVWHEARVRDAAAKAWCEKRGRAQLVVTGEAADGTDQRPRIPYICHRLGVQCMNFLDLIRLEGWKF